MVERVEADADDAFLFCSDCVLSAASVAYMEFASNLLECRRLFVFAS